MAKTTITRAEHLQLMGLYAISQSLRRRLDDVVLAATDITGEDDVAQGHTSDGMWKDHSGVDYIMKRLGLTVEDRADD